MNPYPQISGGESEDKRGETPYSETHRKHQTTGVAKGSTYCMPGTASKWMISLPLPPNTKEQVNFMSILEVRKLRLREGKWLGSGHIARSSRDAKPSLSQGVREVLGS